MRAHCGPERYTHLTVVPGASGSFGRVKFNAQVKKSAWNTVSIKGARCCARPCIFPGDNTAVQLRRRKSTLSTFDLQTHGMLLAIERACIDVLTRVSSWSTRYAPYGRKSRAVVIPQRVFLPRVSYDRKIRLVRRLSDAVRSIGERRRKRRRDSISLAFLSPYSFRPFNLRLLVFSEHDRAWTRCLTSIYARTFAQPV